jgi:hypothetical protein
VPALGSLPPVNASLPDPASLLPDAPRVAEALDAAGWSADALDTLLGATARSHLDRDELAPLLRRTDGGTPLEVLARLFVVGTSVDLGQARRAGVPETWLVPAGDGVAAPVRLQPGLRHARTTGWRCSSRTTLVGPPPACTATRCWGSAPRA